MPRKIRVPADKEANRQSQQLSRQRHREYVAGLEKRLNEMERRGIQATIEVQEAARAVAVKNERLLALLALHGVSDDEINAFLTSPPSAPPRGSAPGPSFHSYSGSRNGHPPWDIRQTAHEIRRPSMPGVPAPCYPKPATMEPRQSAEAERSPANVPSTMPDPVQNRSQCLSQNWNQDQSPPTVYSSTPPWSTPAAATCPETVSYTTTPPSYPHEEPRVDGTSRCGPPGGGCGPRTASCKQENARTATCVQAQSRDNTPQRPASTSPRELSGQMITSCDVAASIIAEMYRHGDITTARASLACATEGPCFINNLDLLELMERHG